MTAAPPPSTSAPDVTTTLQKFGVPGFRRLWVLGASRRKSITIYSQQLRALVLAHALAEAAGAKAPSRVAIVGGGIGGMTLARALGAAFPACELHVLERKSQLLNLVQGCRTRWLHPTINSWPVGDYLRPAKLPFLGWRGGFAHDVATAWLRDWDEFRKAHRRVHVYLGVHVRTTPQEHGDKIFLEAPGLGIAAFDLVVLAVGFGIESQFPGAEGSPSYWTVDTLEQELPRAAAGRRRILISGVGDGGLIDFARSRIQGFDHERTLHEFMHHAGHLGARLEPDVRDDAGRLAAACSSRRGDRDDQELNRWLKERLRGDTEVTLLGDSIVPFTSPSANINRALALRILEIDSLGARFLRGRLSAVERRGDTFSVRLSSRPDPLVFDEVVIRHGADSALRRDLPDVAELHARHQTGDRGELSPDEIERALAFFADKRTATKQDPVRDPVGAALRRVAADAGWTLSDQDVIAALRWIDPSADWAHRGDAPVPDNDVLARGLADTLKARVTVRPQSKSDLHDLYALVRLLLVAGDPVGAFNIFYDHIRGVEFRSIYEFGLYREDRDVLTALCESWSNDGPERARLLNSLGYVQIALGELGEAVKALSEAERIRSELSHWRDAAVAITNRVEALYLMGERDQGDEELDKALKHLEKISNLGLFRIAKSMRALSNSGGILEADAYGIWRLPEPPDSNTNEILLANLCDVRLFAGRIKLVIDDARGAIAHEALQYFGFAGPGRRPCVSLLDRAIVDFLAALLVELYGVKGDRVPSLSEALWEVGRSGDLAWQARCALAAHRARPKVFPEQPWIPPEAKALRELDPAAHPIAPLTV